MTARKDARSSGGARANILDLADSVRSLRDIPSIVRDRGRGSLARSAHRADAGNPREIDDVVGRSTIPTARRRAGATRSTPAPPASPSTRPRRRGQAERQFPVDFANFARAGLKHLKTTGVVIGGELAASPRTTGALFVRRSQRDRTRRGRGGQGADRRRGRGAHACARQRYRRARKHGRRLCPAARDPQAHVRTAAGNATSGASRRGSGSTSRACACESHRSSPAKIPARKRARP